MEDDLDPPTKSTEDLGPDAVEIVVLDPDEKQWGHVTREPRGPRTSFAHTVGERTMSLALRTARAGVSVSRFMYRAAADSGPGRVVTDAAAGALGALGRDGAIDWDRAEHRVEEQLGRVISVVAPVVVQSIDPEELLEALDIEAVIDAVDINALLDRVDVNTLLDRVDVNALLDRVDVNTLLDRVDVDALLDRVGVDALLERVTVQALIDRVDVDGLVARVDVNAVARRAQIGELVAESTGDVAGSALDLGRRQAVALDTLLARALDRVLGRDSDTLPQGPPALTQPDEEAP